MKGKYFVHGFSMIAVMLVLSGFLFSCGDNEAQKQAQKEKEEKKEKALLEIRKAWANVSASSQKRADLVANAVQMATTIDANFPKDILQQVSEAREKALAVKINDQEFPVDNLEIFEKAQKELKGALSHFLQVVETNDQLKNDRNFQSIIQQLEGIENEISVRRRNYNDAVTTYYQLTDKKSDDGLFKPDAGDEKAPKVDFGN